ncbi:hypothetical protein [Trichococcus pasteurii]|uniref:hypothetical protein n=1 Tax=Trichococcus pasteurii TaxID=43064 RepID=UPI001160DA98|nr:hypothetical protein [Trichococcus pasteurii]
MVKVAWVVRFFGVIGQATNRTCNGCPINRRYRTTIDLNLLRLSDSLVLSDKLRTERTADVRFIDVIGQPSNIRSKCSKHNGETRKPDNHRKFVYFTKKSEGHQHPHADRLRFFAFF